ncbi:4Fe-4S dicluster domain-containing protein [Blattabacterium cuenoti]|uniref:4Fe-4S dicluster domain-containing protein n=1 Tax=Blattabacterium cuenoti TaxID=1653831 RepID=UPI00163CAA95|nr:4Fe-4S dicluster domain-containing protein [Blattabacterium cuenoti]
MINNKKKKNNSKKEEKNIIKNILNQKTSRRDFLKWIGFSTASATLAACKGPVIKSIPYVVKPDIITPGIPTYYASTMMDSFDIGCVLVKTREGRPIKIEPNFTSKYLNTTSVRIQSSILSLYDEKRLKNPFLMGKASSWDKIDDFVINHMNKISQLNKDIVILSSSYPSYSTKKLFKYFQKIYPTTKWITYDAISYSIALDAAEQIFGIRAFPYFDLSEIELIISFDADFLSNWSPISLSKSYSMNRSPGKQMSQHIQLESNMTLSGANADIRMPKTPSDIKHILFEIYQSIFFNIKSKNNVSKTIIDLIKQKKSKSVILADGDKESYILSFLINSKINSKALKTKKFIFSKESNDKKFQNFINDVKNNKIGILLIHNTNPFYSFPLFNKIKNNIPISIYFTITNNDTSQNTDILLPIPHWLESWGDSHPITDYYTLMQPTIHPIFNTRQFQDSLLIWSKNKKYNNYYNFLKKIWEKDIIPNSNVSSFNEALFHGIVKKKDDFNIKNKFYTFSSSSLNTMPIIKSNLFELRLYIKIGIGDGTQYDNPWLQEFPDPITRTTWENYLTISPFDANKLDIKNWITTSGAMNGHCVNLIKNDKILLHNIPVYIQPGQSIGTIGLSFGYGQTIGKLSKICTGTNAYKIYKNFNIIQLDIQVLKSSKIHKFSCVQVYNYTEERNIIKNTDLNTFLNQSSHIWNEKEKNIKTYVEKQNYEKNGHHFQLAIDLNSCIGCGSCVIACHSENNVPIVGKQEIRKSRDMHWIRIDRYYSSYYNKKKSNYLFNPNVSFVPLMCQHCENAPCETVCPVGATTHGTQGQNMMTYNRCVGTRYCANNCPYKVRRFNWFNYVNNHNFDFNMNNSLGKMVINPDVVVRSRGVMEKCSMCIQRTQYVIGMAKKENRTIKDEEFETACSISCPTNAIIFGDVNDPNSKISKTIKDNRNYKILEFLGINPNVSYNLKVRNK